MSLHESLTNSPTTATHTPEVCPVAYAKRVTVSSPIEGMNDLLREWERKLKEAGLSMHAGESSLLHYSPDPETFPTKELKRDRSERRRAKTAKLCACGVKFFGWDNQKYHNSNCAAKHRMRSMRAVTASLPIESRDE